MIKIILTIYLAITSLAISYSQNVKFGIMAGPAFVNNTRENQVVDPTRNTRHTLLAEGMFSYFGGVTASAPLSKYIIFRPQLEYIQKGWQNHLDYVNLEDITTRTKANCIDLPLNLVYNIPTKNGRFFAGVGPYLSYVLSGKVEWYNRRPDVTITFDPSDTAKPYIANRVDIGANIIAGYEFRNGLFVTINYSNGFRDFRRNIVSDVTTSNKSRAIELGIGYMFNKH